MKARFLEDLETEGWEGKTRSVLAVRGRAGEASSVMRVTGKSFLESAKKMLFFPFLRLTGAEEDDTWRKRDVAA